MKQKFLILIGIAFSFLSACTSNNYINNGFLDYGKNTKAQTALINRPYADVVDSLRACLHRCLPASITAVDIEDDYVKIYVSRLRMRKDKVCNDVAEIAMSRVDKCNIFLPHYLSRKRYVLV